MAARRLDEDGWARLGEALVTPGVVRRYRSKIVTVAGSDCWWWTGAISGRGHGRFWFCSGQVVIAHRFGFALARGVEQLHRVEVLGHRCDNPLCQRIGRGHLVASSYVETRREWAIRKELSGSPLGDPRGSRRRARELWDLARRDPVLVAADLARLRGLYGQQLALWPEVTAPGVESFSRAGRCGRGSGPDRMVGLAVGVVNAPVWE